MPNQTDETKTMTVLEFLSHLRSLDAKLWIDDGRLRCSAPAGVITPALRAELTEHKEEILKILLGLQSSSRTDLPILPIPRKNDIPLSFAQQRLWFLDQLEPDSAAYSVPVAAFRLGGRLDAAVLERSLNEIVRRHESLRTTFAIVDDYPAQIIAPTLQLRLPVVDLCELPATEREGEAQRLTDENASQPFDLTRGPLVRAILLELGEEEHAVLLMVHHIISDVWSRGIFIRELTILYQAFVAGKPSPLPELPIQYADFAIWQREWLQGAALEEQVSYWKAHLSGAPTVLELPTDRPRPPLQVYSGGHQLLACPRALSEALKALSRQEDATLFMTLLAAFATLLYRYTGQDDVLVGLPIANRTRNELEGLIGLFANTLVLRADMRGNPNFRQLLQRVREAALGAYSHQDLPFEALVEKLQPARDLSRNPLFQVMFALHNVPTEAPAATGLAANQLDVNSGATQFELSFQVTETEEGLNEVWEYNTGLFDASTIERMTTHFHTLLEGIVVNPEQRLSDLPLLTEPERQQLLVQWNSTQEAYDREACLHHLFEAQVHKTPDAIAIVFEDASLTYRQLDQQANQLAHHLRRLGVRPATLVAICLERSLDMLVGLLGVLKAGAAYVPLDPTHPAERLAYILQDAALAQGDTPLVLLTQEHLRERFLQYPGFALCLDSAWNTIAQESLAVPDTVTSAENLAYVIYTSGSTGKPKGVQIPHRAVVNFLHSMRCEPGSAPDDILLAVTTLSFDIAGLELYLPLTTGGRVLLVSHDTALDGALLGSRLAESHSSVMQATPSTWRLLLDAGWAGNPHLRALCGGEAFPCNLANRLAEKTAAVWNMYGPTETTIWSTIHPVLPGSTSVPIGHPIANTQLYVLDRHLNPSPVGVAGDLYIGGDGLAWGYRNRPELTAETFIPHPFGTAPGARLYHTGDLARYLPDGNVEFLGRVDHQVKVRGFRIELGEIEAVLAQHPAVRETVVTVREDTPDDKRLVAYVVANDGQSPTVSELRRSLEEQLPAYMIPSAFVTLEALPRTPNRKIDRRALPPPEGLRPELEVAFISPRNELERKIAAIWQEVLQVEQVGIRDNFFDLGGHSYLLIQVHSRLSRALNNRILMTDLFKYPTIDSLARYLGREESARSSSPQIEHRIEQIEESRERLKQLSQRAVSTRAKLGAPK
jgi:amino acid adenylation domain-containing protein